MKVAEGEEEPGHPHGQPAIEKSKKNKKKQKTICFSKKTDMKQNKQKKH